MLIDHVRALCSGEAVPVPIYDYINYTRSGEVRIVGPANIVVIEGILVLNEPELRELFDLKVYVDTDADLRFIRRLQRDVVERGRTPESIIAQYLETVRPSHLQFIEPSKRHADVIIPHGGMNALHSTCCWPASVSWCAEGRLRAGCGNRTHDIFFTREVLCRLS